VKCPKCKTENFLARQLSDFLVAKNCAECEGNWITGADYEAWQRHYQTPPMKPESLPTSIEAVFSVSQYDTKAALCPECNRYMPRAKVNSTTPFYLDRCASCAGIWCDSEEWEILEHLGLAVTIPQLFSNEWQMRVQHQQQNEKERQATIERLGPGLAQMVFDLAEELAYHPYGDFAVAYLMRKINP